MVNEPVPTASPTVPPTQKKRHGCLTTWLILIIVFNLIGLILLGIGSTAIGDAKDIGGWYLPTVMVLTALVIVCTVGLFYWKKWGFWGIAALEIGSLVPNIIVRGYYYAIISAIVSIAILYGVLQIGGDNKGWSQLE
jgi:hypothetical protein